MIGPGFQEMNILFVLTFENNAHRRIQVRYFLPTEEIKGSNLIIDGKKEYDNIWKVKNSQGDDYTSGCLLD